MMLSSWCVLIFRYFNDDIPESLFRTSASNCARIYNDGLALCSLVSSLPAAYSKNFVLDVENVWDGVCLYWLLEDAHERDEVLVLNHDAPNQAKRLQPAMCAPNLRMTGPGQEAWNHACELCCRIHKLPDGRKGKREINLPLLFEFLIVLAFIRSTVTDGVTIRHPTCCIHDCDIPLESVKNRYCPIHRAQDRICVVTTCSKPVEAEYRTCNVKEHGELEDFNAMRNKAMFQFKQ